MSSSEVEANGTLGGGRVIMSEDGRHLAFDHYASNLAPYDLNNTLDVFVRDRVNGTTELVSVALTGLSGNNFSFVHGMSRDGRFIVCQSSAYDLVKYDTNGVADVCLLDRDPDVEGNGASSGGGVSLDGTKVVFSSVATNLVAGDSNGFDDVFIRDLVAGTTTRASVTTSGAQANQGSFLPQISDDGAIVMFMSYATHLVGNDKNNRLDVFVRDLAAGTTGRVSVGTGGVEGNGDTQAFAMAADGQSLAFDSYSSNIVSGDTNNSRDIFRRDRTNQTTTLISISATGVQAPFGAYDPRISQNGSFIAFNSAGKDLAGVEPNNSSDVFVHDVATGELKKVSVHVSGAEGAGGSFGYAVSDDGNPFGFYTVGVLCAGVQQQSLPTGFGGTLRVVPAYFAAFLVDSAGATISEDLPLDDELAGALIYAQVLELDPGASKGVSFTPGIELVLGE